ncbi:MAG: hypothetical protein ACTH8C_16000, partial [Pseudomonas taetrolens]|uniref:hypothetical protein n=1 Tax=Pseudomonas taetrolens TaxID=47884 RepID=UPI003F94C9CA
NPVWTHRLPLYRSPLMRQQVVGEFRHQHMRQQACGRDALVDYLGRHRRLDQRFALPAGPFPTHMLFDAYT